MANIFNEIGERRVLPAVGVYAGSCWVLIEILDRLVERYLLSPYITDIAFWGLYSLIPAVILVAWTHGKPGKDEITTAEKVGIPINLIATVGLLITAFGGKDLGAAANLITVANEEGIQETHYVANESFKRRLAVFFFEPEGLTDGTRWLAYGATELLIQALDESPFISALSPWGNFADGIYSRMKTAGYVDGFGVPRSLMREIASDANRQHFVTGRVAQSNGEYTVSAEVWETSTLTRVAEFSRSGLDLFNAVDDLSSDILASLEVPTNPGGGTNGLPLAETYGESSEAFRHYIDALNARLFNNDMGQSLASLDQSLEADPNFVRSWFMKAGNLLASGDLPSAQQALSRAQELDYRLPASDRGTVKRMGYRLSGQTDKLIAFLEMEVRLRGDASSHQTLGAMLTATGQLEKAKDAYLQSLEQDPLNYAIYLQLATLERGMGNIDGAISYATQFRENRPEDMSAALTLGDLLRDAGDLAGAEELYTEASLLEDRAVSSLLKLAFVSLRRGETKSAMGLIEEAEGNARTSQEKAQIRGTAGYIEYRHGRLRAGIEQLKLQGEYMKESMPPFQLALSIRAPMIQYFLELNDITSARAEFAKVMEVVQPPLDQFMAFSEASILIEEGDFDGAREAIQRGISIIEQFKLEDMYFQVDFTNANIAMTQGDYTTAVGLYERAIERITHMVIAGGDISLAVPQLMALLAASQIQAGDLDAASRTLDRAFDIDPAEPKLWLAKASLQQATGQLQLAQASVIYALAIWENADADYKHLETLLRLQAEIQEAM